jgi:hypothetical protein
MRRHAERGAELVRVLDRLDNTRDLDEVLGTELVDEAAGEIGVVGVRAEV